MGLVQNASLEDDPNVDRITQTTYAGGGCFVALGDEWHQVVVQLESSFRDPHGLPSSSAWARAASLTDPATRQWLLRTMLGQATVPGVTPSRGLGTLLDRDGGIVLLWLDSAGTLFTAPFDDVAKLAGIAWLAVTIRCRGPWSIRRCLRLLGQR